MWWLSELAAINTSVRLSDCSKFHGAECNTMSLTTILHSKAEHQLAQMSRWRCSCRRSHPHVFLFTFSRVLSQYGNTPHRTDANSKVLIACSACCSCGCLSMAVPPIAPASRRTRVSTLMTAAGGSSSWRLGHVHGSRMPTSLLYEQSDVASPPMISDSACP